MPVVNQFEVSDWMCMEALDILLNNTAVARHFNTAYNDQFQKPFPVGDTVHIPLPWRPKVRTSLAYVGQAIERTHTDVVVDKIRGIDAEWNGVEKALHMGRGRDWVKETILEPAFAKLGQEIDDMAAEYAYLNTPHYVGTLGTNPSTVDAVYGASNQIMTEMGIPLANRKMVFAPHVGRALRAAIIPTQFNPADKLSKMFNKGILGEIDGMETFETMSLYQHTSGVWSAGATLSSAGQSGSSLTITASAGDTFLKGDIIGIGGIYPINPMTGRKATNSRIFTVRVTEDLTAAGGGADVLKISPAIVGPGNTYQNVDALPANGATLYLFGDSTPASALTGTQNMALHSKLAFAMVAVPMEKPESVEQVGTAYDKQTGIRISYIRAFDPIGYRMINRFDLSLIGFGNLYADAGAAVRVLSA